MIHRTHCKNCNEPLSGGWCANPNCVKFLPIGQRNRCDECREPLLKHLIGPPPRPRVLWFCQNPDCTSSMLYVESPYRPKQPEPIR